MSVYNSDELQAPDWINENFLLKVLKQYENTKDIEVHDINSS